VDSVGNIPSSYNTIQKCNVPHHELRHNNSQLLWTRVSKTSTSKSAQANHGNTPPHCPFWRQVSTGKSQQHLTMLPSVPEKVTMAAFRLATHHNYLQAHLQKTGTDTDQCPLCNNGRMVARHSPHTHQSVWNLEKISSKCLSIGQHSLWWQNCQEQVLDVEENNDSFYWSEFDQDVSGNNRIQQHFWNILVFHLTWTELPVRVQVHTPNTNCKKYKAPCTQTSARCSLWSNEYCLSSKAISFNLISHHYIDYCNQKTILIYFHIWMTFGNVISHYKKTTTL
jgi:hypothetical protein